LLAALPRPRFGLFGGVRVRGPMGRGRPILTGEGLSFNGRPSFETFQLPRVLRDDRRPSSDGLYWDW
jgi:hypothetical protein